MIEIKDAKLELTRHPFGVEVKYQSRIYGWDEQSISKGIGQGVLVTRDSFKWNKICHIPLPKIDTLILISSFNIEARYPDMKRSFRKKCTEEYTFAEKIVAFLPNYWPVEK